MYYLSQDTEDIFVTYLYCSVLKKIEVIIKHLRISTLKEVKQAEFRIIFRMYFTTFKITIIISHR